jgi:DNA-binding HxlR family transcriptional regulator
MRRRDIDGCPISGLLQLLGDRWTLLVIRDLLSGARRTTDLLEGLYPISSRTLLDRLRELEKEEFVERISRGGSPPRVEYMLTRKGYLLSPLIESLRQTALALNCNDCEIRMEQTGSYCNVCPSTLPLAQVRRPKQTESIVLL